MSSDLHIIRRLIGRWASIGVLVGAVALIAGCDLENAGGRDIKLSHKAHIEKRQMECVDCHEGAEDTDTPGMPGEELCLECHKTLDNELQGKEGPAGEKCLYCHNPKKDVSLDQQKVVLGPGPSKDLIATHAKHSVKGVGCESCHGDIAADDGKLLPRHRYMPSAEGCMNCHEEKGVSDDCAVCHNSYGKDAAPDSHKADWTARHGIESMLMKGAGHGKDCGTCHTDAECIKCHTQEAPRDHTNFWRQRGHGIKAGIDREACLVCHKQDSCSLCHSETAPRSHKGAWKQDHCRACHLQSSFTPENNTCAVCHRQIPHKIP